VIRFEKSPYFFAHDTQELGLASKWAKEYVKQSKCDTNADKSNIKNEDLDVTYSKFMKFITGRRTESNQRATASLNDMVEMDRAISFGQIEDR